MFCFIHRHSCCLQVLYHILTKGWFPLESQDFKNTSTKRAGFRNLNYLICASVSLLEGITAAAPTACDPGLQHCH